MSLPYFPMYPSDFEAKTSHLTILEDGAYNRLLRLCWMTPGCSLPADEEWIMRRARAQSEEEKQSVRTVLNEFFKLKNGRYSNPRLTRELAIAKELYEKRVSSGRKGGISNSLKRKEELSSNAVAMPKQPEPEPEPEEVAIATSKAPEQVARKADPDFVFELMHVCGHTSGRIPTYWLPPASTIHVQRWMTDLKLTRAEILEAAKASRKNHNEPPNGPKALDRVMQNLSKAKAAGQMTRALGGGHNLATTSPRADRSGAEIPSQAFPDEFPPADPKFVTR